MVAAYKNFGAKRKQCRTRASCFARCPEVFAALGKDRGLEGNINRIPKGGSCPIGISPSMAQTRQLVPYPIGISPSMAQGWVTQGF